MRWSGRRARAVAAIGLALALAACSADDGEQASGNGVEPEAEEPSEAGPETEDVDTGSTVPDDPDSGVLADEIRIGWMGDVTGPTASAQTPNLAGTEAYFAYVNEQGGVLGRRVSLSVQDDEFQADRILSNFRRLVDDERVLAIVQMGQSELFQQDVREAAIPLIAPPQTTDENLGNPYSFNVLAHYGDQADVAIARLAERVGGVDDLSVVVVQLRVPSGDEWNAYVQRRVQESGGTYAGRLTLDPAAPDASFAVTQLEQMAENEGVNAIAFHGAPSTALQLLDQMARSYLRLPIVGIHGLAGLSIYEEGPEEMLDLVEAIHSFYAVNVDSEGGREIAAFVAGTEWEDIARQLNFSHGWVAGMALHQAMERAARDTGVLTRETLFEALQGPVDTKGLSCAIDWRQGNHLPCAAPFRWDGEGLVPVAPFDAWQDVITGEYGIAGS